jgi:formylglycine-generating enzyme required for sulfatase activity
VRHASRSQLAKAGAAIAALVAVFAADVAQAQPQASAHSFKDCADCPEMVVVPAGRFTMGSPSKEPGRAADREDQVQVTIARPFAVGAFAVTRGEYAAFVAATKHTPDGGCYIWTGTTWVEEADRSWRSVNFPQDDRHPVTCVSFADAKAYAAWLSSATGKAYRLLSEAEREYVTRAGTATPFWWGPSISAGQANYDGRRTYAGGPKGNWLQRTLPVHAFAPNAWGLYNVHGNVWDWTEDCWNEKNAGNPGDGTAGTGGDCTWRVVRGGAWNYDPAELRSAHRYWNLPQNRNTGTGFRVARAL